MIWLFIHLLLYFSTNCSFPFNIYIIQSCVMIHPLRNINTNFKQQRKFTVVFEQRWGQLNNKTRCILHLWYFFFLESNFEPYPSDNSWQAWLPHCSLFVTLAPGPLAHRLYLLVRWGLHKKKKNVFCDTRERTEPLLLWLRSFLMCRHKDADRQPHGRFACRGSKGRMKI